MNKEQPIKMENIETTLLVWGEEFGELSWVGVQNKLAEINAGLSKDEKIWRLPSEEELLSELDKSGSRDTTYWLDNGMVGGDGYIAEHDDGVFGAIKYVPSFKTRFVR